MEEKKDYKLYLDTATMAGKLMLQNGAEIYRVEDMIRRMLEVSGLKTAALNLIHNAGQKGEELDLPSFAASFAAAISDTLIPRIDHAAQLKGYGKIVAAGGVAANSRIRRDLTTLCQKRGYQLYLPELKLCGDNGAMIGCQGFYEYQAGVRGALDQNGFANMDIGKYF